VNDDENEYLLSVMGIFDFLLMFIEKEEEEATSMLILAETLGTHVWHITKTGAISHYYCRSPTSPIVKPYISEKSAEKNQN